MPEPDTPLSERPWEDLDRMVSVDDALDRVLASVSALPPTSVPLLDSLGLTLSDDLVAMEDVPPYKNSAMDGYAVRAEDTIGASTSEPIRLEVLEMVAAGSVPTRVLQPGTAIRIMTGAPLPEKSDAVVRFEETNEFQNNRPDQTIDIFRGARHFDNVRPAGEDISSGSTALAAGTTIRPPEIGLLSSLNQEHVLVHRQPRVAILSTGDEVVDLGPELHPGQIRNSNSYTLAAYVQNCGGLPIIVGVASDSEADLTGKLSLCTDADFILTSGGVSMGDYDLVKDVMQAEGEIAIWQVRMKPGKPLAFGSLDGTPLLGLPGNPVAAAVSFLQFGRPAIWKMQGRRTLTPPTVLAKISEEIENRGHRRHYVRVRVDGDASSGYRARIAGQQGAGVLSSMTQANGLLVIPEDIEMATPGMKLSVQVD